jgi:Fe-S-cluster containining protein
MVDIDRRTLSKVNIPPEVRAVWSQIPDIDCKQKCQESCGPWSASTSEIDMLEQVLDETPDPDGDEQCPLLEDGDCQVYRIRPTICRLWGVADGMPCPWGCEPERRLYREEADALLDELGDVYESYWDPEQRANAIMDLLEEEGKADDVDREELVDTFQEIE